MALSSAKHNFSFSVFHRVSQRLCLLLLLPAASVDPVGCVELSLKAAASKAEEIKTEEEDKER